MITHTPRYIFTPRALRMRYCDLYDQLPVEGRIALNGLLGTSADPPTVAQLKEALPFSLEIEAGIAVLLARGLITHI
jgi:hypothetical protein